MRAYLDSSAVIKSLVYETCSDEIIEYMASLVDNGSTMVSSIISVTEVRRVLLYKGIDEGEFADIFDDYDLMNLDMAICEDASRIKNPRANGATYIKSLDALHIQTALTCGSDAFVTYDDVQARAAKVQGLKVISPGTELG
jgi:predicted nucleic acid-binding protein